MDEQLSGAPNDAVHSDADHAHRTTIRPAWASAGNVLVVVVLVVALSVGAYALFQMDSWGENAAGKPERFQLDLAGQMAIPPELLAYARQRTLEISLQRPVAIDVSADGTIYVAGDRAVERLDPDGSSSTMTQLENQPSCLVVAVGGNPEAESIYVGTGQDVLVLNRAGDVLRQWTAGNSDSLLSGIAVAGEDVFVADAGHRIVKHFDTAGELIGTIGNTDPDRQMPGFVVPSPCFDVVIDRDSVLHVVNPGMRRVEAYDFEGNLQAFWGRGGPALPDFFGCCNPARVALTRDGWFVTSEKGLPRIKVYSSVGDFQHVVAGPEQLGVAASAIGDARGNQSERVFDIAVNEAGEVLVLDAHNRQVIVFQPLGEESES